MPSTESDLPSPSEAALVIAERAGDLRPEVGIVLGSGLGGVANEVEVHCSIDYQQIPGITPSTAPGHQGRLVLGRWNDVNVALLQGRSHLYEGHGVASLVFPIEVLHAIGVRRLLLTNSAGGLNPQYAVGDLVLIRDHVDFTGGRLRGPGSPDATPVRNRIPRLYDPGLISRALSISRREEIVAWCGTYVCVTGPNYETRAEYRMFRALGGDMIGMSTVPEGLAAARLGMRVLGISTVTNVCAPDLPAPADGESVVQAAETAAWKMTRMLRGILHDDC